jgi:hypothetical protein
VKEEYAAYEDLGAVLKAFLDYRSGKVEVPFASLMAQEAIGIRARVREGLSGVSPEGIQESNGKRVCPVGFIPDPD